MPSVSMLRLAPVAIRLQVAKKSPTCSDAMVRGRTITHRHPNLHSSATSLVAELTAAWDVMHPCRLLISIALSEGFRLKIDPPA